MSDQIFVAQSNVIRRLAAHGPCVIVGRCADMILDDSINLFIYSKMRDRIKRMLILEPGSDEKEMERRIREVDRKRKEYYQYYTGNTWGRAQNYHLCLDSGLTGVDGCLRAVGWGRGWLIWENCRSKARDGRYRAGGTGGSTGCGTGGGTGVSVK